MTSYEEYIKPPKYESGNLQNEPLINKLRIRISQDINQINGVYDSKIKEFGIQKNKIIQEAEKQYNIKIDNINRDRKIEIDNYNKKAEYQIDQLLYTLVTPTSQKNNSWWHRIFYI